MIYHPIDPNLSPFLTTAKILDFQIDIIHRFWMIFKSQKDDGKILYYHLPVARIVQVLSQMVRLLVQRKVLDLLTLD